MILKLVTFRIDRNRTFNNTIANFHTTIHMQQPLILYQFEIVPVPVGDKNTKADYYAQLHIKKLYLALNTEDIYKYQTVGVSNL